jgi:hypothetical protein
MCTRVRDLMGMFFGLVFFFFLYLSDTSPSSMYLGYN